MAKLLGRVPSRFAKPPPFNFVSPLSIIVRSILLLEDLDAAFTRGISRDEKSTGAPNPSAPTEDSSKKSGGDESTLSLSGLLNSLDGVAATEGRRVFS